MTREYSSIFFFLDIQQDEIYSRMGSAHGERIQQYEVERIQQYEVERDE